MRWKAITPAQKLIITNMVLMPAIEYRLQAVNFDKKTLQGWDRMLGREAVKWFGWNYRDGYKIAFFSNHQGGLGLWTEWNRRDYQKVLRGRTKLK